LAYAFGDAAALETLLKERGRVQAKENGSVIVVTVVKPPQAGRSR
jgi:hypothetical protein